MADRIREVRINNNLSQAELAKRLHISQPMISDIESGKKSVPADIISKIPIVLDDAKTKAELAYESGNEFFNVPLLKNVDDNPKNILEVLIEEMSEAIGSIQELKRLIKNAKPGQELDDELKEAVYQREEQIADLFAALKMHFVSMECYGIKLKDIEKRINLKLKKKGYV
jgi:transcriptional regulator with XRE-family HTH domain